MGTRVLEQESYSGFPQHVIAVAHLGQPVLVVDLDLWYLRQLRLSGSLAEDPLYQSG